MSATTPFEKDLERKLKDLSADISMSPELEAKIKLTLRKERGRKGVVPMKHRAMKRVFATAVALSLTTVTVLAGSALWGRVSHGSSIPDYKTIPTEEQLAQDLDYIPKVLPEFSNGLSFKGAHIIENQEGEDKFTSMDLRYAKKGIEVSVSTEAAGKFTADDLWEKTMYNDMPLYYSSFKYKAVPENYELTEEEAKAQEAGTLGIGYGASEISESLTQQICWTQNGVTYILLSMDETMGDGLSKDELLKMAQEYIDYR